MQRDRSVGVSSSRRALGVAMAAGAFLGVFAAAAQADVTVTFTKGPEGWSVNGNENINPVGGNPDHFLDHYQFDTFGVEIRNDTNPDFIGDYTGRGPIRLGVDVKVDTMNFFGSPVSRDLIIEFVDYDNPPTFYPYVSVWAHVGTLQPLQPWTRYEIEIQDPASTTLPPGWGGTGDEDPITFEPRLPPDRTFASVMAGVDEVRFSTFVPGFFYGGIEVGMGVDNVSLESLGGACEPDITTGAIPGQAGYLVPNGIVNNDDFFAFLTEFAAGNLAVADVTTTAVPGTPGYGEPNGVINNDDFFYFLTVFSAGC